MDWRALAWQAATRLRVVVLDRPFEFRSISARIAVLIRD
jgi:hypothetical protein